MDYDSVLKAPPILQSLKKEFKFGCKNGCKNIFGSGVRANYKVRLNLRQS